MAATSPKARGMGWVEAACIVATPKRKRRHSRKGAMLVTRRRSNLLLMRRRSNLLVTRRRSNLLDMGRRNNSNRCSTRRRSTSRSTSRNSHRLTANSQPSRRSLSKRQAATLSHQRVV